jgi:SAM-dependent methyltransferase
MEGYGRETYGAAWAADYDDIFPGAPQAMIDRLAEFAEGARVLELAIGTGRVAIPLAARGIDVTGIDISDEMVAKLRAKAGGAEIPVVMSDFTEVSVEGSFRLVFLVFNTLFALEGQEDQVRCFRNVAAHLDAGGRFVLETFFPDVSRFDRGQRLGTLDVDLRGIQLEASRHDRVSQRIDTQRVHITNDSIKLYPVAVRYAWPTEMDLMARLAGLELEHRWGGWSREPFGQESRSHVSVYRSMGEVGFGIEAAP